MRQKKKKYLSIILSFIALASIGFIIVDWKSLISKTNERDLALYSYTFKAIIVFLTSLLVFIAGKDYLDYRDIKLMRVIFALIIVADAALILFNTPVVGILFFSFVQLLLIFRNSYGMREKIKSEGDHHLRKSLFINTILVTTFFLLILLNLINMYLEDDMLLFTMLLYSLMISLSLWAAIANYLLRLFPNINSIMIALGMIFFVLCDINVGLSLILPKSLIKTISSNLIWIFYTPALTLLALSSYKYEITGN